MSSQPSGRVFAFPETWINSPVRPAVAERPVVQLPRDEDIIFRIREGDSGALKLLFDRYSRLVLGIANRILHDYGEAEEIAQEVFFQIFQKANLFDASKGAAKAWIVQITFHRALDRKAYLVRRGFHQDFAIESVRYNLSDETELDRELGARLNRAKLEKAFGELSEMQRETLKLFFFEGLEVSEIMDRLNESLGNVRHHLYRGLEHLRKSAFVQKLRDR